MKFHLVLLAVLLFLLLADVNSEKLKKHKKFRHKHKSTTTTESSAEDQDVFNMMEEDEKAAKLEDDSKEAKLEIPEEPVLLDPCSTKHCGAGQVCDLDENGEAQCICIPDCPVETEPRRKVCSNHNETWGSDCQVYQMRCWCNKGDERCLGEEHKHVHIEYYGECREMPTCKPEEMADFPRRMRDWLFNIMRDLADRQELTPYYFKMEREAETNLTRRWTNAAIWKWCDLDGHPHDRTVSRHELFPIRAPLMALEHCIAPFLNSCDVDDDHKISLKEWGTCLELEEDDLEEKCDDVRGD
ncbi:SPARC [Ischnura elegans]|uniref:SPARC n=1 Tax=Ischnura elegans TaxID=197161 RepID=UPI001ED89CF2|nr:SPARC [Ischnura elegans]XP_046393422.1 SPARC [Ischnura elegans]